MALTEKTIKFLTLFVVITILGVSAYYLYPLIGGEQEQPPSISISTSKFQGLLKKGDVCKLPGYEYTKAMVDAYKDPTDLAEDQKYELAGEDHLYHADEELSIKEILDLIVPVEGNKVIIVYYNPSYTTSDKPKGFHLYPKVEGTNEITDPNAFKIQPNQGFAILSCKDTEIWKVKNEEKPGKETLPSLLVTLSDDWILVPMINGKKIDDLLTEDAQVKVTSVWLQKGPGFDDFEKVDLKDLDGDYLGYYMAWFKVDSSIVLPPKDEPKVDVEEIKEMIEDTQQDIVAPPPVNSTEVDEQIETTGEAQIEKAVEEAVGDSPYGGQGHSFDLKETIFEDSKIQDRDVTTDTTNPSGQDITDTDNTGIVIIDPATLNFGKNIIMIPEATKIEIIGIDVAKYSSEAMGTDVTVTYKITGGLNTGDKIYWGYGGSATKTVVVDDNNNITSGTTLTINHLYPYTDKTKTYKIFAEVQDAVNGSIKSQTPLTDVVIPTPVSYGPAKCAAYEHDDTTNDTFSFGDKNCHPRILRLVSPKKCVKPSSTWCPPKAYINNKFNCTDNVWETGATCNIYTP